MLYAVIGDVHGNSPALKAVLKDAQRAGAQQYLFLGDYITDFPFTKEIVEQLRSLDQAWFIAGNREQYMDSLNPAQRHQEQYAGLFLAREALGEEGLRWVRGLPKSLRIVTPDGAHTLFLQHDYPVSLDSRGQKQPASGQLDELFPYRDATHEEVTRCVRESFLKDASLPSFLEGIDARVFLHGHSHLQYAVELYGTLFVNPGSCGLPLDHQSGAPYTLLHYEQGAFFAEERRVFYDLSPVESSFQRFPAYQTAYGWNQLNLWQLRTARDHNRVLFRFLKEEQDRVQPQTDEECNAVLKKALALTWDFYQQRKTE